MLPREGVQRVCSRLCRLGSGRHCGFSQVPLQPAPPTLSCPCDSGDYMPRILLADDSPHAQRMGERILSEEGYEVVTVSDGDSALIRLEDVDPDVVLADAIMPKRSGYEICQFIKLSPRHRRTRVLVTIGALETL